MAASEQTRESLERRAAGDDVKVVVSDGDVSTSDEAVKVLQERGVDAWRRWVAAQR